MTKTPERIYTNRSGEFLITPPSIPLHATDIEWVPASEVERLQAALRNIDELNMLPPDENGDRWWSSDLIGQECHAALKGKP